MFSIPDLELEDVENAGLLDEIDLTKEVKRMDIGFKDQGTIYLYGITVASHKSNVAELRQTIPEMLLFDSLSTIRLSPKLRNGAYIVFRVAIPVHTILDTLCPADMQKVNQAYIQNKSAYKGLTERAIEMKYAKQNNYQAIRFMESKKFPNLFCKEIQITNYRVIRLSNSVNIEF